MGRDPKHDYRSLCIYHITIGKAPDCPVFSRVGGSLQAPAVQRTPLGQTIGKHVVALPGLCEALQVLQYVVMPDHVHILLFVREYLPRHLGRYIGMMKVKCGQEIRANLPGIGAVFTPDFHDRYLRPSHKLETIFAYIRQNPYRLLVRRSYPYFFRRINNLKIGETTWQAYCNIHLLDNPFKAPVVIHRSDSEAVKADKLRRWSHLAENGGVLVSPFISPGEKGVHSMCEEAGGRLILLSSQPLREKDKPAAHDFGLCAQGRLLILAPMAPMPPGRATFLYLNSIAEKICGL